MAFMGERDRSRPAGSFEAYRWPSVGGRSVLASWAFWPWAESVKGA